MNDLGLVGLLGNGVNDLLVIPLGTLPAADPTINVAF